MVALGKEQLKLEHMETDLDAMQTEFEKLTKRIEILRSEGSLGGRLNVISTGEAPLSPSSDRRLKFAPAAAALGLVLPAGVIVLLSFVKRRYRYVDETMKDASLSNVPLLGMLPNVGRKHDPDVMHATAHGIHQMRVLLCANTPKDAKRSYLVTSSTEGEGKTNLTVALGMSFAAGRQRTLVIDCDFIGRRLTQGFKAEAHEGLLEAMREGKIGPRVRQEAPSLFVLPTGRARAADACGITAEAVRGMLQQAHKDFDTILIDTGPILGSLEAAVLAQEVDGVILTISRGQHPALVEHALRRLHAVRARIVGAVFNRAKLGDFHGSAYTSSQASSPAADDLSYEMAKVRDNFSEFGPLVRAVSVEAPAAA
jgi:Mrp family chromosome partitioning ATPase